MNTIRVPGEPRQAGARMQAASLDLHDVLSEMFEAWDDCDLIEWFGAPWVAKARAALDKAAGK